MAWKLAKWALKTGIDWIIIIFALLNPEIVLLVLIIRLLGVRWLQMTRGIWWFCEKVSEERSQKPMSPQLAEKLGLEGVYINEYGSLTDRIGGVIRKYRNRVGLKQSELAEELTKRFNGEIVVSIEDISTYELGFKTPPAQTLEALADMYGITIDTLFGRK